MNDVESQNVIEVIVKMDNHETMTVTCKLEDRSHIENLEFIGTGDFIRLQDIWERTFIFPRAHIVLVTIRSGGMITKGPPGWQKIDIGQHTE